MTRLKVGVVGSGIGASHIEAYQALPDLYEVAALCDIDAARAGAVAEQFGIPATADRLERPARRATSTSSTSARPPACTRPRPIAALEAGFHVVVEKPVARSLAEVDALAAAEAALRPPRSARSSSTASATASRSCTTCAPGASPAAASVATAETHWYRGAAYYGQRRLARHLRRRARRLPRPRTPSTSTTSSARCSARSPRCTPAPRNRLNRNETEDMAVLSLAFAYGAFATSSVTLGSRQEMSRLRFCFDELVAESGLSPYNPGHDPWTFPHDDPDAAGRIDAALADFAPLPERFVGQFHRLHAALTGGGPLPVTLADARRSIELLTAAYYSALTGEPVALPLPPDHPFYAGWLDAMKSGREAAHG